MTLLKQEKEGIIASQFFLVPKGKNELGMSEGKG